MTQALRWNLYGDDHLSDTLSKLAKATDATGNGFNKATEQAQRMGRGFDSAEHAADRLGDGLDHAGRQAQSMAARVTVADRATNAMHATVSRVGGLLSTVGGAAMSFGTTAAIGLGIAGAAAVGFGLKMAAANETAMVSFKTLLGSEQAATAFIDDLKRFAANTPFDMPGLRTASSQLLAAGVAAKDVIPLLTRIGDSTAAMNTGGEGISRAVYALQQIRGSGRATLEDLNQLGDAGVPIFDALAASLHTTQANIREMVSAGKISSGDVFGAVLSGAGARMQSFTGLMETQSKTLTGIWSAFTDNAGSALADFMAPALPVAKEVLGWFAANVPKALDYLQDFGGQLRDVFKDSPVPQQVMDALRETGHDILPKIKQTFDMLVTVVKDNKEELETFGRFIADVVIPVGGELVVTLFRIGSGLAAVAVLAATLVVPTFRWMTERTLGFFDMIIHGAEATFGWIPGLGDKLRTSASEFDTWAARVRAQLDALDGKTVDVNVRANMLGSTQTFGAAPAARRASGGFTPAGELVRVGEQGPETVVLPRPGFTIPAGGGALGGGDREPVIVQILLDTGVIWQGMLRYKSRTGKRTLGFD